MAHRTRVHPIKLRMRVASVYTYKLHREGYYMAHKYEKGSSYAKT
jgi:hypothetical protein